MALLERLRHETAPYHQRIERCIPLLAPGITVEVYRRYLSQMWGFYVPTERRLRLAIDGCAEGLNLEERQKTPLLERDLRALGVDEIDIERLPHCATLPDTDTPPRIAGCLYVLEGATLGGQFLVRRLRRELPLLDKMGALSFLDGYGDATGARWRAFCAYLTHWSDISNTEDFVVASAIETFRCLELWLHEWDEV